MIEPTIKHVIGELNRYLEGELNPEVTPVSLAAMHKLDGAYDPAVAGKVITTLVRVEQDTTAGRAPVAYVPGPGDRQMMRSAAINLNAYLLFAACFDVYSTALTNLSAVITFFSQHRLFEGAAIGEPNLRRVELQMENLTMHELSNMWGMFGMQHMPSVVYQMRMISVGAQHDRRQVTGVRQPTTEVSP